jgi:hypothetical protein
MNFIVFVVLLIVSVISCDAGLLGGRNGIVMPPTQEVLEVAAYAGHKIINGAKVQVISGTQQVVAGIL